MWEDVTAVCLHIRRIPESKSSQLIVLIIGLCMSIETWLTLATDYI
jgi:hypothetical protein